MTRACPLCSSLNPPEALFCLACGTPLEGAACEEASAALLADNFGPLPSGTLIRDETLVLVQVLGQGGFGITYLAREFSSGRSIAVKELFPFGCVRQSGSVVPSSLLDESAWQAAREGFRREGALLTGHAHPHVVQVLDVWDERGTTFLAMEFLDGQTLAQVLEHKGALSVRRVRAMIEQVGDALRLLHHAGMLHRDIKPENIMLCRTERPVAPSTSPGATVLTGTADRWVLLDFGAARAFAAGRSVALTQIVTPGYAPLEQYASRARGGPPSDIYALGATAYHALTGIAPPAATERASQDELIVPEALNPNIPRALSRAIVRALALRIDARPPSVEVWLRELDGVAAAEPEPVKSPFAAPIPAPPLPSPPLLRRALGPAVEAGFEDHFGGAMEVFERQAEPLAVPSTERSPALPWAGARSGLSEGSVQAQAGVLPGVKIEEVLHGNVWYRVTVNARRIVWPKKCACCGGPMMLPLDVKTPAIWWQLPYCAACRDHAERGEAMTVGGSMVSGLLLAIGLTFLLLELGEGGLVFCALALLVKIATSWLPSWVSSAQRAMNGSRCCSYLPAGRFKKRDGDTFVWEFRSHAFAEEFCALNGGDVGVEHGPTAPPVANSARSARQRISH